MADITWEDKDKDNLDGIHNKWRDSDANEVKTAVNSKYNTPGAGRKVIVFCGSVDVSGGSFPTGGGTGGSGGIEQGNTFRVSVGGVVGGALITAESEIVALVDTPGQTLTNWWIKL